MLRFRSIILSVFLLYPSVALMGQDLIIKNDGRILEAKVERLVNFGVYYRLEQSQKDTVLYLPSKEVKSIRFGKEWPLEDTPDNWVVNRIDDLYNSLVNTAAEKRRESIKGRIDAYYSLLKDREERVRSVLLERVFDANDSNDPSLFWLLEEYMMVVPLDRPGRASLYVPLSQFYETSMNLDALESIQAELGEYETVTGQKFPDAEGAILAAIDHVQRALLMGDEMVGFWVSDLCDDDHCPLYYLYVSKNQRDSIDIHLCTTEYLGDFGKKEGAFIAQRTVFNGIQEKFGFTFATDKIVEGQRFLSNQVIIWGSALAATAADMATKRSDNPSFKADHSYSFIMSLTTAIAAELAKSRKKIEIIDIYGSRVGKDLLSARFLYANNVITAGEEGVDSKLEKDKEFKFYRVSPDDDLKFLDEDGQLRGPETEYWSKEHQSEWWKGFLKSQEFNDLQDGSEDPLSGRSKRSVIRAYNKRSFNKLNAIYGIDEK